MLKFKKSFFLSMICATFLGACGGAKSSSDSEDAQSSTSSAPINSPYASQGPIAYQTGQGAYVCKTPEYATDNPDCKEYFSERTYANDSNPKYRDQNVGSIPNADAPIPDHRRTNPDWNGDDPRVNGKN
jgi:hypothetical protein